jgi:hypothetical protein
MKSFPKVRKSYTSESSYARPLARDCAWPSIGEAHTAGNRRRKAEFVSSILSPHRRCDFVDDFPALNPLL